MSYAPATDEDEFRWIALEAAIRNVVTFLELSAAAQRGNRDATAWLPGAHATLAGMELVRKSITLDGTNTPALAASSETAGDLSESRRFRSPTKEPSDEGIGLLPAAPGLGGGGITPPAANSALGGAAELELDKMDPKEIIRRRPSAIA